MKKITTFTLALLIVAGLVGGGIFFWMNNRLEKSKSDSKSEIDKLAKQVEIEKITPYEFYPSGVSLPDPSNWKTYTNSDFGYSFQYPDNWTILDNSYTDPSMNNAKVSQIELLPTRYYKIWKDMPKTKDGTVPNENITCYPNKSADELLPSDEYPHKGLQNINIGADGDEQAGKYYLSTALWDIEHHVTDYKGNACDLSRPTTDVSPLTKEEDAVGYTIIQTFKFNKSVTE
jgi:hypothetical protein